MSAIKTIINWLIRPGGSREQTTADSSSVPEQRRHHVPMDTSPNPNGDGRHTVVIKNQRAVNASLLM